MTSITCDQIIDKLQSRMNIKNDQLNHRMAMMSLGKDNDNDKDSNAEEAVAANYQGLESKSVIDLDGFWKIFDELSSLENEVESRRRISNIRAIKKNVDTYILLFKDAREDVFNKSVQAQSWVSRSVASYELELLLRFEDIVNRLQQLSSLLDVSGSELDKNMLTIMEVSKPLRTVVTILEHKLSKFLHDYVASVTKSAEYSNKEGRICLISDSEDSDDDWKVVLPSSSSTINGKPRNNKKKSKRNGRKK